MVTIDFIFAAGVTDVSFDIFDVDMGSGQWIDFIYLRAREFGTTDVFQAPTDVTDVGVTRV